MLQQQNCKEIKKKEKRKKKVCITRESNAGPIDGNDRGYHYPSNASLE